MKDLIKRDLEKTYNKCKECRRENKRLRDLYREYKGQTIQYTLQAIDCGDTDIVCENMAFLYKFEEIDDARFLVNRMLDGYNIYMLSRVIKSCRFIFQNIESIDYYFDICKSLLENDVKVHKFVKSIIRSIGEYIVYDAPSDNRDILANCYKNRMSNFTELCNELGYQGLADEISLNYMKQIKNIYVK